MFCCVTNPKDTSKCLVWETMKNASSTLKTEIDDLTHTLSPTHHFGLPLMPFRLAKKAAVIGDDESDGRNHPHHRRRAATTTPVVDSL